MKLLNKMSIFLSAPLCCFATQKAQISHPQPEVPFELWLTGPFLSPTAVNMEPRHPAIEPAIAGFAIYGQYNDDWKMEKEPTIWAINPILDYQFGITDRIGIEVLVPYIFNYRDGKTFDHFQDTIVNLGFQLADDIKDTWVPDFRLLIQTLFPSGNFHRLDPDLFGLDQTGQGAIQTGFELAFQKLFYLPNGFFMLHWSFGYLYPQETKIEGFNAFGGGFDTKGTLRPGETFIAFLSGEYAFTSHWVFAIDFQFFHQTKTSEFRGRLGIDRLGNEAKVGLDPVTQIAATPSIEYNFTSHTGMLFGTWFTIAGRNASAFASLFFALIHIF